MKILIISLSSWGSDENLESILFFIIRSILKSGYELLTKILRMRSSSEMVFCQLDEFRRARSIRDFATESL